MVKILHFADAHIDMVRQGVLDPESGLPLRAMDFLKSLDTIVAAAINEKVDLVIFAGDAYRDRSPSPTYQREWGRRMKRLSLAQIPTLLLTGNHDISPAQLKAHALQEYETLKPDFIHVASKPGLLGPDDLNGVPVQVVALPWVSRSGFAATLNAEGDEGGDLTLELAAEIDGLLNAAISELDPQLPTILAAHASVEGAKIGQERLIMIGRDVVLKPSLVKNKAFDYTALGHIHLFQDLNPGAQPPVVYPGSIERVDFGEAQDVKGFVIAEVSKGAARYEFRQLETRPYLDLRATLTDEENVMEKLLAALPDEEALQGAMVRFTIAYPRQLEALIDEQRLRERGRLALQFVISKKPLDQARGRIASDQETATLTPLELLDLYWKENPLIGMDQERVHNLASEIIRQVEEGES